MPVLIKGPKHFGKPYDKGFFGIFAPPQVTQAHREHQASKTLIEQFLGPAATLAAGGYEVSISHGKQE
ncbi:hypothetical protein GCM10027348_13750 [Hymenobacter tenuis]